MSPRFGRGVGSCVLFFSIYIVDPHSVSVRRCRIPCVVENAGLFVLTDFVFAFRMLIKTPGFTLIAVLTLALEIGANTAIFSVVNALLLRPLPLPAPERLVAVRESKEFGFEGSVSAANLRDWIDDNHVFSGLAAWLNQSFALQGKDNPERIAGARVTPNYFRTMGTAPLLGRTFADDEKQTLTVISESLWRRQFGGAPAIIGQPLSIDGVTFTVIGVMPASFGFPSPKNQVWTPLIFSPEEFAARGNHNLQVVGRLRDGVAISQASAEMNALARTIAEKFPEEQRGRGVKLIPLQERLMGASRTSLLVLLGSVICVLLIGSANLANLLLARTAGRQREVALRLALGASRGRLIRQFLTESLLLGALGGAGGLLTASWGINLLAALIQNRTAGPVDLRLDATVLAFTGFISVLVGVTCGLAPARGVVGRSAADLQPALHGHSTIAGANRLRSVFVTAEIALAVVLLSGAGLLLRSFAQLRQIDSGLTRPEQVLTARIALPLERYATTAAVADFYERTVNRISALPGVSSAGVINLLPLAQWGWNSDVEIEGRAPFPPGKAPLAELRVVSGDYFGTVGVRLVAGRLLDARDRAPGVGSILINRTLARLLSEKETQALGMRIKVDEQTFNVVGVVGDVRQSGLDFPPQPEMYFPIEGALATPKGSMAQNSTLVIRASTSNPSNLIESLRRAMREIDPTLPLFQIDTLDGVISESIAERRLNGVLLAIFAAVALGLAALGLYGVVSYTVTQRVREVGIRVALGARRGDIFRLVVGGGMRLATVGLVLGVLAALGLTRLLKSLLFDIAPSDPVTFIVVVFVLGAVALLANFFPARRAMAVDPMVALRHE